MNQTVDVVNIFSKDAINLIQRNYDYIVAKYFGRQLSVPVDREILPIVGKCMSKFGNARACRAPMKVCFDEVNNLTDWVNVRESSFFVW